MSVFCCFGASEPRAQEFDSEGNELPTAAPAAGAAPEPREDEGLQRVDPVIRSYLHRGDATSCRRYILLLMAVSGGFMWWLGPVLGIFVVDPLIQLLLLQSAVITPVTECFDFRKTSQVCDTDIYVDYYFWNITNADQWTSGAAPPAYEQVGPFAFKAKEVRYDMQYNADWTEVSFTYHQWAELQPEASCPTCTLDAPLTGVNRGYLQFLAAPAAPGLDPESGVIYQLMPITLSVIRDSMRSAIYAANPASTTIDQDAVNQWADCAFLLPLMPVFGLSTPYLKDVPLPPGVPGFPYNPELCAYIPGAVAPLGLAVTPADFGAYGLAIDHGAAATFLALAIGQSNSTYLDPAAAQFVGGFLTLPRATVLAYVGSASPAAAASLGAIDANQWLLLQGYLASLVPTWGSLVFSGWLAAGGGGLITTKSVGTWMNGFEDPLLLVAAQAAAPSTYRLAPWTYTPSLALSFATEEEPMWYFGNVTGQPYSYSNLTWNSSDLGHFMPLIQAKRMLTGKAQGSLPQDMLRYRGLPFANKTNGIINVTGVAEGVAYSSSFDPASKPVAWDSVLWRPVQAEYAGYHTRVKSVDTLLFNMTPQAVGGCNWTAYGDWALSTGFDPGAYDASVNAIPPGDYWALMTNDTALGEYLQAGPMGSTLGRYFAEEDVGRDRCANPDLFQGMWDMSSLLACPTIYTFPHYLSAGDFVVNSTGINASVWAPDFATHGYALAIEPFTGYAIRAQKTYQVNHLVTPTPNLFPNLWVPEGTGAATGQAADFITVPTFWVRMWWEPTDTAALVIRALSIASDAFYYLLVVCWPVLGWLQLGPALFVLRFGRDAKARRRALPQEQRSRARQVRLTAHEKAMVDGLERQGRGSAGVELPEPLPEGTSELAEADAALEAAEGGVGAGARRAATPALISATVTPIAPIAAAASPAAGARGWGGGAWNSSPRVGSAKVVPADANITHTTLSVGKETPLLQHASSSGSGSGAGSSGSEAALLPAGAALGSSAAEGAALAPPPSRLGRSRGEEY